MDLFFCLGTTFSNLSIYLLLSLFWDINLFFGCHWILVSLVGFCLVPALLSCLIGWVLADLHLSRAITFFQTDLKKQATTTTTKKQIMVIKRTIIHHPEKKPQQQSPASEKNSPNSPIEESDDDKNVPSNLGQIRIPNLMKETQECFFLKKTQAMVSGREKNHKKKVIIFFRFLTNIWEEW